MVSIEQATCNTYIHDGIEVVKTGRTAFRFVFKYGIPKSFTLTEIKPVNQSFDWKKWVDPEQLYVVYD